MKTTYRIAKAELQVLFYSPVAWLILVIFALQTGIVYTNLYGVMAHRDILGQATKNITQAVFNTPMDGFFTSIQGYLYLYIPLLTMGVISREFNSGSIKLLYSSPVSSFQIVLGKYLALIVFAFTLIGILGMFSLHGAFTIENFDYPAVLCALLGLFLLICAYAAVGLFMSSITSYTVVAAIGTLAILALLNLMKSWWQEIEFVRDITYWIAISGRSNTFISGLITSEDLLYFIMVILLFVSFTIIKLQVERKKTTAWTTFSRYAVTLIVVCLVGYVSALPSFKVYYDTTYSKVNTISENSQKVVGMLKGPLTIHTYANMLERYFSYGLPKFYKREAQRFEKYLRFKPDLKLEQTLYYHRANYSYLETRFPDLSDSERMDSLKILNDWSFDVKSYDEISDKVDLSGENYRYVHVLEAANGRKTFLRIFDDMTVHPSEAEVTAAFKRLVMELPKVGFVEGHGERQSNSNQDRGYNIVTQEKTFRYSLLNQGFDFANISLASEVPADIQILVIAEPRQAYSPIELKNLENYIAKGGNLIIAGEPDVTTQMNEITKEIGVKFMPGTLVHADKDIQPDVVALRPSDEAVKFSFRLEDMKKQGYFLALAGSSVLQFDPSKGFEATTLFRTPASGVWIEKDSFNTIDKLPVLDVEKGESEQEYPAVMALSRTVNDKQQKILVTGDADWLSNKELGINRPKVRAANYYLIAAAFFWLSDGKAPIDMRLAPPIDNKLNYSKSWKLVGGMLKIGFPLILALAGVFIWMRRRAR